MRRRKNRAVGNIAIAVGPKQHEAKARANSMFLDIPGKSKPAQSTTN